MGTKIPEDVFFQGLGGVLKEASTITVDGPPIEEENAALLNRPVTRNNLFSHPDAHPFVLDMALLKAFQLDWFNWEADTLFKEIVETFNTSIADVNRMKILAASSLHVIDYFWESWEIFENTVLALNGVIPRIGYIQPPDLPLLMAGVDIANSIRKEEFSDEVCRYAAAVFLHDQVSYAPKPLDFCQFYVSMPKYHCAHCGKSGSALPPFNGRCDSCSGKFDGDHPFNFKASKDAKDDPKDVSYSVTYDHKPTEKRYKEILALPPSEVQIKEVAEDIEAARLIIATDYMSFRQNQRDKQFAQIKVWMASS